MKFLITSSFAFFFSLACVVPVFAAPAKPLKAAKPVQVEVVQKKLQNPKVAKKAARDAMRVAQKRAQQKFAADTKAADNAYKAALDGAKKLPMKERKAVLKSARQSVQRAKLEARITHKLTIEAAKKAQY